MKKIYGASHGNYARKKAVGVDLTSMLDVVFILLIFFVVTASFAREIAIDINRPTGATSSENESIVIKILENNELWMAGRRVDINSIELNIAAELAEDKVASLLIQAHKLSETKMLVAVMDAAKEAGVDNISLTKISK